MMSLGLPEHTIPAAPMTASSHDPFVTNEEPLASSEARGFFLRARRKSLGGNLKSCTNEHLLWRLVILMTYDLRLATWDCLHNSAPTKNEGCSHDEAESCGDLYLDAVHIH